MTNFQKEFNELFDKLVRKHVTKQRFPGQLGTVDGRFLYYDGNGDLVPNMVWVTVKFADTADVTIAAARCRNVAQQFGLHVWLSYSNDGLLEVVEEDTVFAEQFGDGRNFNVPEHRWTHVIEGPDPIYVEGRQIMPLLVHPNEPTPDLNVYMRQYHYQYGGVNKVWATSLINLTSYVPSNAGEHKLVIVCLDPSTNLSSIYEGTTIVPVAQSTDHVPFVDSDISAVNTGADIRAAAVRLYNGQTEILWSDIFLDLKSIAGGAGDSSNNDAAAKFLALRAR